MCNKIWRIIVYILAVMFILTFSAYAVEQVTLTKSELTADNLDGLLVPQPAESDEPAVSTLIAKVGGTVTDVNIKLNFKHATPVDVQNLYVTLVYAGGTRSATIVNGLSFTGDILAGVTLDDESGNDYISQATGTIQNGTFKPDQFLSGFDLISAAADWNLNVYEAKSGGGTRTWLQSWELIITYQPNSPVAPSANDDTAYTDRETVAWIKALENDTDENFDFNTITITSQPPHGNQALAVAGDQLPTEVEPPYDSQDPMDVARIKFTPDPDFFGETTLNYTVTDDDGLTSNEATVTVHVDNDFIEEGTFEEGEDIEVWQEDCEYWYNNPGDSYWTGCGRDHITDGDTYGDRGHDSYWHVSFISNTDEVRSCVWQRFKIPEATGPALLTYYLKMKGDEPTDGSLKVMIIEEDPTDYDDPYDDADDNTDDYTVVAQKSYTYNDYSTYHADWVQEEMDLVSLATTENAGWYTVYFFYEGHESNPNFSIDDVSFLVYGGVFPDTVNATLTPSPITDGRLPNDTYQVAGTNVTQYKYRVNDSDAYSAYIPIATSIDLYDLGLAEGSYNLSVVGNNGTKDQSTPLEMPFTILYGDFNNDGQVDSEDMTRLCLQLTGLYPAGNDPRVMADCNENHQVDLGDAAFILQRSSDTSLRPVP